MSITRIKAIILQEYFITKGAFEIIMDLFFFSIMSIIVFGFVSIYLSGQINTRAGQYLLLGMLLWEIIRVTQYSISVSALWNIWAKNLGNMFISPLSLTEFVLSQMLAGIIKSLTIFTIISFIAAFLFNFDILKVGVLNLLLFFINLTVFSWSLGLIILGVIFRFGTRIQVLAWGFIFLFEPLTASLFPVSVLPAFLQKIAYLLPPTYVFEAARANLINSSTNWAMFGISFGQNVIYFAISVWIFNSMFAKSKETGQFAKNEG